MKRTYRNDMTQQQKDKIAAAHTGKTLSPHTRELIAKAMREYWATLPMKPTSEQPNATGSTPTQPQPPQNPFDED